MDAWPPQPPTRRPLQDGAAGEAGSGLRQHRVRSRGTPRMCRGVADPAGLRGVPLPGPAGAQDARGLQLLQGRHGTRLQRPTQRRRSPGTAAVSGPQDPGRLRRLTQMSPETGLPRPPHPDITVCPGAATQAGDARAGGPCPAEALHPEQGRGEGPAHPLLIPRAPTGRPRRARGALASASGRSCSSTGPAGASGASTSLWTTCAGTSGRRWPSTSPGSVSPPRCPGPPGPPAWSSG